MTTLSERLNHIIREQNLSKAEFARQLGVTVNYIYIMTGNSRKEKKEGMTLSTTLARLIAMKYGYDEEWILNGDKHD